MGRFLKQIRNLFILLIILTSSSIINAQPAGWDQIGLDITGTDNFGKNVSFNFDGTIMAIGAPGGSTSTGYAAVYQNQGGSWVQLGSDISGEVNGDWFGRFTSLSADGTVLAVGAPRNGEGYVKLYEYSGVAWIDKGNNSKLVGAASGDRWGECVSLSADGTIVAIGAYLNDDNGSNSGEVRVYEFNSGTSNWDQIGNNINGSNAEDYAGYSVSLSSDGLVLAVGSYQNDAGGSNAGTVRLYEYNIGTLTWDQKGSSINGETAGEFSGVSVSLNFDGSVVAIGAYAYDVSGLSNDAGCTRIYEYVGSSWNQISTNINGKVGGEQSGKFVDLNADGTIVVIGAPLFGGRARIYINKYGNWQQVGGDFVGDIAGDYMGYSVAINNDGTIAGIGEDSGNKARVYSLTIDTWTGTADDNDWSNAANWDLGIVPDATNSVVIPAGLTSYPTLTGPAASDDFTIESASLGTGSLVGQSNLTVNGTTTVQRYMTGTDKWHLISSPAPGQSISSFLTSNTLISSKGVSPVYRAMADYNETTNLWNSYFTDAQAGNMDAGKGFEVLVNADSIIVFNGTLEISLVQTAVPSVGSGWNCVGNPYPSAIYINETAYPTDNFITENSANLDDAYQAIYVWNPATSGYDIITGVGAAFKAAVGQAFMVRAKIGVGYTMDFTPAMQTHDPSVEFKGGIIGDPEIKLIAELSGNKSSTKVSFKKGMTDGLDIGYDVGIFKSVFNLYSKLVKDNGVDFGIQYLPETSLEKSVIALGIETASSGSVQFYTETENLPEGVSMLLEDRLLGTFTALNNGNVYTTQVQKNELSTGRFYLHTSYATTSANGIKDNTDFNVYYSNERIYIAGQVQTTGRAMLYDLVGRKIQEVELERSTLNHISTSGMKNGVYMLSIQYTDGTYSEKIVVNR